MCFQLVHDPYTAPARPLHARKESHLLTVPLLVLFIYCAFRGTSYCKKSVAQTLRRTLHPPPINCASEAFRSNYSLFDRIMEAFLNGIL